MEDMASRSRISVTDLFREHFADYRSRHRLRLEEHRAAQAMMLCRTERLGRYESRCANGHVAFHGFHACHHRSCPRCNGAAGAEWLARIQSKLLTVPHFHVVFTLPHELQALWCHNRVWFSNQLFRIAAESLKTLLRNPRHLGAEPAMLLAQHTWGRTLVFHPHIHALVSAGGLRGAQWIAARTGYLVPGRALAARYRGQWLAVLNQAAAAGALQLPDQMTESTVRALLKTLARKRWHVRIEGRYEHGSGLAVYLSRYVRGGPLHDRRLLDATSGQVRFPYLDHRDHQTKRLTLSRDAFIGRVLSHVPPARRHLIRYFGLYHAKGHARLNQVRSQLALRPAPAVKRVAQPTLCAHCQAPLRMLHYRRDGNSQIRSERLARRHVQPGVQADAPSHPYGRPHETGPPLFF